MPPRLVTHRAWLLAMTWVLLVPLTVIRVHAQERGKPLPSVATEKPPSEPSRSELLITGISTFVGSYVSSVAIGLFMYQLDREDCAAGDYVRSCKDSMRMLIPLVGPFMAVRTFGALFLALLGGGQIVGALMTVVGSFRLAKSGDSSSMVTRPKRQHETFFVDASPLPGGGVLSARVAF